MRHRAALAFAAGLLVLAAWRLWPTPGTAGAAPVAGTVAAAGQASSRSAARGNLPPVLAMPALPAQAAVWDLCGIGRMPRPAGATALNDDGLRELPAHLGAEPAAEALSQTVARMDEGDARSRAAAVLLRGFDAHGLALPQALEELAENSGDIVVSAWAALRCVGNASCTQATERWTQREPGNAAAWLLWLRHHQGQGENAEQALARATHFRSHQDALLAATLAAVAPSTPAYLEPALWVYAIGVQAALPLPQLQQAMNFCPAPALSSPARRSACEQLARLMTAPDGDPIALWQGQRLAERLALPAETLQRVQQQVQRANTPPPWLDAVQPLSCASVDAMRTMLKARTASAPTPYSASPPQSR